MPDQLTQRHDPGKSLELVLNNDRAREHFGLFRSFQIRRRVESGERFGLSNIFGATNLSMDVEKDRSMEGCTSFRRRTIPLVGKTSLLPNDMRCAGEAQWLERHKCHGGVSPSAIYSPQLPESSPFASESGNYFRRLDMKPTVNSSCSFSRIIFQDHTTNCSLPHLKHGSRNSLKGPFFLFSGKRNSSKSCHNGFRRYEHIQLKTLTEDFNARMQNCMLFPNLDESKMLMKFNGIANGQKMESLHIRTTFSNESQENGFFKMLDFSTNFSHNDYSGASLPLLRESAIDEEKEINQTDYAGKDYTNILSFVGTNVMKMDIIRPITPFEDPSSSKSNKRDMLDLSKEEISEATSHVNKLKNLNSDHSLEVNACPEPSNRWVKRLKLQSMDPFALGTKCFMMDNASSSERSHKLFTKVLNYTRTNSGVTLAKCLQEEKVNKLLGESNAETIKKSNSWLRRWWHPQATLDEKGLPLRPDGEVFCDRKSTKDTSNCLEGRQFPSIKGMALMGRAISNFRPCVFRRRGSLLVWNTEEV